MNPNHINITIKMSHRTYDINLPKSEYIYRVHEELGNKEGIPSFRIRTLFQDKILDKNKTIESYGFTDEATLKREFLVSKDINLYINIKRDKSCVLVNVENTSTIYDIKRAVESSMGIDSSEQELLRCGYPLSSGSMTIFESGIKDGDLLDLEIPRGYKNRSKTNQMSSENDNVEEQDLANFGMSSAFKNSLEIIFAINWTDVYDFQIEKIKTDIKFLCEKILREIPDSRIAIMVYGKCGELKNHVFSNSDFTSEVSKLAEFIKYAEQGLYRKSNSYKWILQEVQKMRWTEKSSKMLVVIGDCEPHLQSMSNQCTDWHSELDILRSMDIKVYCALSEQFLGSYVDDFYPELCRKTHGSLIKQENLKLITYHMILRDREKLICVNGGKDIARTNEFRHRNYSDFETDENNNTNTDRIIFGKDVTLDEKSPQFLHVYEAEDSCFKHKTADMKSKHKLSKCKARKLRKSCAIM